MVRLRASKRVPILRPRVEPVGKSPESNLPRSATRKPDPADLGGNSGVGIHAGESKTTPENTRLRKLGKAAIPIGAGVGLALAIPGFVGAPGPIQEIGSATSTLLRGKVPEGAERQPKPAGGGIGGLGFGPGGLTVGSGGLLLLLAGGALLVFGVARRRKK